ncbi:MAG: TrkA family potassium uptake protein [Phycisphaerales bacterium]
MKFSTSQMLVFFQERRTQRNVRALVKFICILAVLILVYSVLFHLIMEREGQQHSWLTGFYWTLTVMSTLGFGDITFQSDLGRLFSMIVLATGIVFLLVLLPFTIIQFFYAPWVDAVEAARTPRKVAENQTGHVILINYDAVTVDLIAKLEQSDKDYVLIVPDFEEASKLHDMGVRVMFGALDQVATYSAARAESAALIAATSDNVTNTNVAFMARQLAPDVPIVSTSTNQTTTEILKHAGATCIFQLGELVGQALARCMVGGDAITHVVGSVDGLLIAEANAQRTPLVGKTLMENRLSDLGVSVIGLWDRGEFQPATPTSTVTEYTILMLAGSREQLTNYDEAFVIYNVSVNPVLIIGWGKVGEAAGVALTKRGVDWRAVELDPNKAQTAGEYSDRIIIGDATDPSVLKQAGLMEAPAVLITTHDDSLNIYLTIYCRSARPDAQLISRSTFKQNIDTLHKAGADFVHSYASMGSTSIYNQLTGDRIANIAEGLHLFRKLVPPSLNGKSLAECGVRDRTGCTVIAIRDTESGLIPTPPATTILQTGQELVLAGGSKAESLFIEAFGTAST